MVSRELQARAGLLQARAGHLGLGGRLVLVAYRMKRYILYIKYTCIDLISGPQNIARKPENRTEFWDLYNLHRSVLI